jgi:VCBS repeat-containing protein
MFSNDSTSANFDGYFLRQRTGSTFRLQDFPSGTAANWVTNTKSNVGSVFTSGTFVNAPAPCATPTVPTAFAADNVELVQLPGINAINQQAAAIDTAVLASVYQQVSEHARTIFSGLVENTSQIASSMVEEFSVQTAHASGETVNVSLGNLDPGQIVTITFDVTTDDPQVPATNSQVCNQGTVSGDNFANVVTDDPDMGGSADPTCTPLAPGTIIIAKDQSPDGRSNFGFTSDIPANTTFNVSGDSSVTIHNVPAGSYTVTEDDPTAGFFALTGLSCDDGSSAAPSTTDTGTRTAAINLESGETVTCTFSNEQIGRLEVVKVVDATPNGETFDLLIDGNVEASGVGDGGSTGEVGVPTGNHSVSETGTNLGNYNSSIECVLDGTSTVVASGSGTSLANIPVNAGDDVLCTITNMHKRGSLEVVKNLEPATDTGSFDMRIDTTAYVATGGDGTTTGEQTIPIGTHLVSETGNGPTNLSNYIVSILCKDNNGTGSVVAATPNGAFAWDVTVNEGDDIVCTITNMRKSTILVQKSVVQGDPNNPGQTFDLNISLGNTVLGQSPVLPGSTPVGLGNLTPDTYTVNETNLALGWTLEDISCTNNFGNSTFGTFSAGDTSLTVYLAPGSEVLCTFTNTFNQAPVANDDSYTATEDTILNVAAPGVLNNDTDADGDVLAAVKDSDPGHGALTLNSDGSFSYDPDSNFCGPDSFTYHANDGLADSNVATVNITVECVDDPPVVSVDVASQAVQYSDYISDVTVTATDVDSHPLSISDDAFSNLSTSGSCTASGDGTSCSWTLSGQVLVSAGARTVTFTVSDAESDVTASTEVVVLAEDAKVTFDADNPVAVSVDSPGSDSSEAFTLTVHVQEKAESGSSAAPGDINLAEVSITLEPIGPGSTMTVNCDSTGSVAPYDYNAILTVVCDFEGVPVNAYVASASVGGGYYTGSGEDSLVIYDPSLGFTTGGGWFYWPGTDDRTTFGYTMKYNKPMTKIQGNLVLIRHLPDSDEIYRIKSNALYGLALGDIGNYGWAVFSGKTTYLAPGMIEPIGNYEFTVYVEDHATPGAGADRVWVQVRNRDGNPVPDMSMPTDAQTNAVVLEAGNIVVPHTTSGDNQLPQASFSYSCDSARTCTFDASSSFDPDGTIDSFSWDFGDGSVGSGQTPSHTYAADGIYTVVLTVTDDQGAEDTGTQQAGVGNLPEVHIGDLDGSSSSAPRNRWSATVIIIVHDASEVPVSGATVSGSWGGGASGSGSCTTDISGQCSITKNNIKGNANSVTFTVSSISGYTYDGGANHDPDGDSDGSSIMILQP